MTPVGRIALGLTLVLVDLRISGLDVVPDVLGWVLVVVGVGRLGDGRWRQVRTWAVVAGVLSLTDLVHPQVTTTQVEQGFVSTSTVDVVPGGLQGLLVSGYVLTSVVVAVLLSLALRDRAREQGDGPRAATFDRFARLHAGFGLLALALCVLALVLGVEGSITPEGAPAVALVVFVLAALAVEVWFIAALARVRHLPWLQQHEPVPSPSAASG